MTKGQLGALLAAMGREAKRSRLPLDLPAYAEEGRDPLRPIAFAGNPAARVCILGRDLGRHELRHAQPLVGPAGRLVRQAVLEAAGTQPPHGDGLLESALHHVFLANLVPYKPLGNRPFSAQAREAFRPYLERLLLCHWEGQRVIALGEDAFRWFAAYLQRGAVARHWREPGKFGRQLRCELWHLGRGQRRSRALLLCVLPHPSPANAVWRRRFPRMLLQQLRRRGWAGLSRPRPVSLRVAGAR